MNLEKFVVIGGMSGVFKIVANRKDGLLIESLEDGKTTFAALRKHNFSPLDSIAIYTEEDSSPLKDIFATMLTQLETLPPVSDKASADEVKAYFAQILPTYDRDRVYINDMKKVIKWFKFLHSKGQLKLEEPKEIEETEAAAE